MHEMKEGKLKSGRSGKTGRSRKQAVVAPCFVFLASDDASYITGRTIHVNGGTVINS